MDRIKTCIIIASVLMKDSEILEWDIEKKIDDVNDSEIMFNNVSYYKNRNGSIITYSNIKSLPNNTQNKDIVIPDITIDLDADIHCCSSIHPLNYCHTIKKHV